MATVNWFTVFFSTLKAGHSGTQPISFQQLNEESQRYGSECGVSACHSVAASRCNCLLPFGNVAGKCDPHAAEQSWRASCGYPAASRRTLRKFALPGNTLPAFRDNNQRPEFRCNLDFEHGTTTVLLSGRSNSRVVDLYGPLRPLP